MVPLRNHCGARATLHTLCITYGKLVTYKLHVRVYGGKHDAGLNKTHQNTANTQKWVNLYDKILDAFKGLGMCCTMDSAYMGDILAQIAREVWGFNFVGTCQIDRTGADAKEDRKGMKVRWYNTVMYQHKTKPLCFAMSSDNNIVKTLSNFHSPKILPAGSGVLQRCRDEDGVREKERTPVPCPVQ